MQMIKVEVNDNNLENVNTYDEKYDFVNFQL